MLVVEYFTHLPLSLSLPLSDGSNIDLTATTSGRDYESEMAELRAQYERQITQLQSKYGEEQSNRSKLEEEMTLLRQAYEEQVVKTNKVNKCPPCSCLTIISPEKKNWLLVVHTLSVQEEVVVVLYLMIKRYCRNMKLLYRDCMKD